MTQNMFGIPITSEKQGDNIVKAINSNSFSEILKASKWGQYQIDYKMFKYFKPDFYKQFLNEKPVKVELIEEDSSTSSKSGGKSKTKKKTNSSSKKRKTRKH